MNNFVDDKKMFYKVSNYANTITFSAIFLPTHKFIGTFTKVGIKGKQLFVSEAAIQDVEGNVIQVEKNNFNQIEIKVTLYYNYIIPQGKK